MKLIYIIIAIVFLYLVLNNKNVKENFYGWIPYPTRNFRKIYKHRRNKAPFIKRLFPWVWFTPHRHPVHNYPVIHDHPDKPIVY